MENRKYDNDQVLWAALRKGDERALGRIFDKYIYVLYNYGIKINKDHALVEDCIQDVFMELWQRQAALSPTSSVKYYLFRCLRRRIYRKLNQDHHFLTSPLEEDHNITFSYEAELIAQQTSEENREKLKQVLDTLSEKQKKVIFLKFYDRLSYEEIAVIMSISVKAVYDLVYHTIKTLRKHFHKVTLVLSALMASSVFF